MGYCYQPYGSCRDHRHTKPTPACRPLRLAAAGAASRADTEATTNGLRNSGANDSEAPIRVEMDVEDVGGRSNDYISDVDGPEQPYAHHSYTESLGRTLFLSKQHTPTVGLEAGTGTVAESAEGLVVVREIDFC